MLRIRMNSSSSGLRPRLTGGRSSVARSTERAVSDHKFKIGQIGPLHLRDLTAAARRTSIYKVTQLLPPEGDDRQYRIKSASEPHERVVKESQLNRD